MFEDESTTTTETTPDEPETSSDPTTEPEPEPVTEPAPEQKDYEQELIDINDSIQELIEVVKAELVRESEEREVRAKEEQANDLIVQEEKEAEIVYKDGIITSLDSLQELTTGTTQAVESIAFSDYSESYAKQQEALDNNFMGINVLIGLVLGIAVAVMFVKGLAGNE